MLDYLAIIKRNIFSPIVIAIALLAGALLYIREYRDAWFISVVIIINALIGIVQEIRAKRALRKLELMSAPKARLVRGDEVVEVDYQDLKVGDEIQVKILKFDPDKERVSLGLKQINPDPWETAEEIFPIDSKWNGKVVSITDYGIFVELQKGVEGLVHVSEMAWTKKPRHPSKMAHIGEEVEVVVLNVDKSQKRISLGMKQLRPNPWDVIAERYPEGTKIEGKIRNVTDFGIFVGIDEGIDGLVHISDISWTQRIKHPAEIYKKGQTVQAVVLNIDKENERFSLGIKQIEEDPWETIPERYPTGAKVTGKVTSVTDFGVFLEIEDGIEGMIHVSELSKDRVSSPADFTKEGETLTAMVLKVNKRDKKIALSIKSLDRTPESDQKSYSSSQDVVASNLGDLLKENLGASFGKD